MTKDEFNEQAGDDEEEVYVVVDENGVEQEVVPVTTFDYGDNEYVVLVDRNDPDAEGLIMRIELEDDEVVLENIEDDEEWNAVVEIYNELLGEDEGEEEDDDEDDEEEER